MKKSIRSTAPARSARPMRYRGFCAGLLAAGCLFTVAACSSLSGSQPVLDPELGWSEQIEQQLSARVNARWEAVIAGDFEKAYAFETPAYRSVLSLQQYKARFGSAVDWKNARVVSIKYDQDHVAAVTVAVEYEAVVSLAGVVRSVREMPEKWLYSDAQWWYISK